MADPSAASSPGAVERISICTAIVTGAFLDTDELYTMVVSAFVRQS